MADDIGNSEVTRHLRVSNSGRGLAMRAGHLISWGAITKGTSLEGVAYQGPGVMTATSRTTAKANDAEEREAA